MSLHLQTPESFLHVDSYGRFTRLNYVTSDRDASKMPVGRARSKLALSLTRVLCKFETPSSVFSELIRAVRGCDAGLEVARSSVIIQ